MISISRSFSLKLMVLILSTVFLDCSRERENNNVTENGADLNLDEIRKDAQSHWMDSLPPPAASEVFRDFNFAEFKPDSDTSAGYVDSVYYNGNGDIVKIQRYSDLPSDNFEFIVRENSKMNSRILYIAQHHKGFPAEHVNGFILIYKKQCFFISFENPLRVMKLDRDLNAIETLRFESSRLVYKTQINYSDSIHAYTELLFKPKKGININANTTVDDVITIFENRHQFDFEKELVVGWLVEFSHIPFWTHAGIHEYDYQATPGKRKVELDLGRSI